MKIICLILVMMSTCSAGVAQEVEMVIRRYAVDGSRFNSQPTNNDAFGGSTLPSEEISKNLQDLFVRYGVTFPEGSLLIYEPLLSSLEMKNTPENHKKLSEVFHKSGVDARQVYLMIWAVEYNNADLNKLEREKGMPLEEEELLNLWKKGKAETVFSQGLRCINGVKSIFEVLKMKGKVEAEKIVFDVIPTFGTDGTIYVVLSPGQSFSDEEPKGSKQNPGENVAWSIKTSVALQNRQTVLLGHSSHPGLETRTAFFLNAGVIPVTGIVVEE